MTMYKILKKKEKKKKKGQFLSFFLSLTLSFHYFVLPCKTKPARTLQYRTKIKKEQAS